MKSKCIFGQLLKIFNFENSSQISFSFIFNFHEKANIILRKKCYRNDIPIYRVIVQVLITNYKKSYNGIKIKTSSRIYSSNMFLSCKT